MISSSNRSSSSINDTKNSSWAKDIDKTVLTFITLLISFCFNCTVGAFQLIPLGCRYKKVAISIFLFITTATWLMAYNYNALEYIHFCYPHVFAKKTLVFIYQYQWYEHWTGLLSFAFMAASSIVGMTFNMIQSRYNKIFTAIGIRNHQEGLPKLIHKMKLDKYRTQYEFDANGTGISEFKNKIENFEAWLKLKVDEISYGKNQSRIILITNSRDFPSQITYQEVEKEIPLPPESFYLGCSSKGILTQKVETMPHMLISGATGTGKSCFFRQALLGLLESTPRLEMYLIDLKGGLEMIDFVDAPNVTIIKTIPNAVRILKNIENRMMTRFDYLQSNGLKQIIPERDKKSRIIVAVDEASVLYAKRDKNDPNYNHAMQARTLADSIAKLSSVAAINLLLATQKLENAIIPTSVSENISGRVAFRANSLFGSQNVIRSKDAADLPEIPGRGIWSFGIRREVIQAPWISEEEVKRRCIKIKQKINLVKNSKGQSNALTSRKTNILEQ